MMFSFADLYVYFCYTSLNRLKLFSFADIKKRRERDAVLKHAITQIKNDGLILEFGVHTGKSINTIAKLLPNKTIYGFDSFLGFPNDGRIDWNQDFTTDIPKVSKNVKLIVGYFEDTFPKFLEEQQENISFMHIDCDIYSSTNTIFNTIKNMNKIREDTIIIFDELINYSTCFWNEILALFRFLFSSSLNIEWICTHQSVENIDENLWLNQKNKYPHNPVIRGDGKYWRQQVACKITHSRFDWSGLINPIIISKIKYMRMILQKITKEKGFNSLTSDDFIEKFLIINGSPSIRREKEESTLSNIPFMKNAIKMQFPEKYFSNFIRKMNINPSSIIEIGGGRRFNMSNTFNCQYINFDFSENTGINTIIKNIVNDDFSEYYNYADIIYTNNTFEHIINPFIAANNIFNMLKNKGILFIRVPFSYRYHPVPNDYWRFSPTGLQSLFSKLTCLECGLDIHARRRDDKGSFSNGVDKVPEDSLGGWRETWFSYFIGQKNSVK